MGSTLRFHFLPYVSFIAKRIPFGSLIIFFFVWVLLRVHMMDYHLWVSIS